MKTKLKVLFVLSAYFVLAPSVYSDPDQSAERTSKINNKTVLSPKQLKYSKLTKQEIIDVMSQDGNEFYYISEQYKKDKQVALAAVKEDGQVLFRAEHFQDDKDVVMAAVKSWGGSLRSASQRLKSDKEVVLEAVQNHPYSLKYASPELQNDRELSLIAAKGSLGFLERISPDFKKDKAFVKEVIKKYSYDFVHVHETLKKDKDIVMLAINANGHLFKYIDESLRSDKEIVLAAIKSNKRSGSIMELADKSLYGDKDFMLKVVKLAGKELKYASKPLQNDKQLVLAAVTRHAGSLAYASDALKNNKEVVLAAVSNGYSRGYAIKSASNYLQNDEDVIITALASTPEYIKYLSDEHKNNKRIVLAAVKQNGLMLEHASKAMRKDEEVVSAAVLNIPKARKFALGSARNSKEIAILILNNNAGSLRYASDLLRNDKQIVLNAVKNNGENIRYASDILKNDDEIIMAAVQSYGEVIASVNPKYSKNRQFVLDALKTFNQAFRYADISFRKDYKFALQAIEIEPYSIAYIDSTLNNSPEFALDVVSRRGTMLGYFSNKVRQNRKVVLAAVKNDGRALRYAHSSLKRDIEVVLTAVNNRGASLNLAHQTMRKNRSVALAAVKSSGSAIKYVDNSLIGDHEIQQASDPGLLSEKLEQAAAEAKARKSSNIHIIPNLLLVHGSDSSNSHRYIRPINSNTEIVRVVYKKIEILAENDLSLKRTLVIEPYFDHYEVNPVGNHLILSSSTEIRIYDTVSLKLIKTITFEKDAITDISISKGGDSLNVLTRKQGEQGKWLAPKQGLVLYRLDLGNYQYRKVRAFKELEYSHVSLVNNSIIVKPHHTQKEKSYKLNLLNNEKSIIEKDNRTHAKILCSSKDGSRILKSTRQSYSVYDENILIPIYQAKRKKQNDRNSEGLLIKHCFIYGDTLLIDSQDGLKKINLNQDVTPGSLQFFPLIVLPTLATVQNDQYVISHHVSSYFGWNRRQGVLLWRNVGPFINRNHWDQATTQLSISNKTALIKPYGWTGDYVNGRHRNDLSLEFDLESGTYIYSNKDHYNERGSYIGNRDYFTVNGTKFIKYEGSEWLVLTSSGYFNASSKKVLNNIYVETADKNYTKRRLSGDEISKWYRPDIVTAILQGRSIDQLKKQTTKYTLPPYFTIDNQYINSLTREFVEN